MAPQYESDGISQLTEIMRGERTVQDLHTPEPIDPQVKRKRRRNRLIASGIITVLVVAFGASYVDYALNTPVGAADATSHVPNVTPAAAATVAMSPEGESAISVAGADEYLGPTASGILATGGGDGALPIASISKLITAMVVLSAKPLSSADDAGPTLTFDKDDHKLYDKYYVLNATIAAMPTGSSMSEHDALETMLVASACNYAEAVAGWAFGSQGAFVSATKKWLAANGLTHTTMVEPTGIDARNTSTPSDLIALGKLAMANPAVAQIVAMTNLQVSTLDAMPTTNDLLGTDGVNGIKTGTLDSSGSDLLYSAIVPVGKVNMTVIGVVLGGFSHESTNADVKATLDSLTAGFHDVPVAVAGQEVGTYSTKWGESAEMVVGANASIFTWSDTKITAKMTTTTLKSGHSGEKVGSITWTAGPNTITVPVVLKGAIEPPSQWWRLTHPTELGK